MTWKSYALMSGAGIFATYLASPPLLPQRGTSAPPAEQSAAVSNEPAVNIEEEAARLQARLRAEAAFRAPARNPFRFEDPPTRPAPSARGDGSAAAVGAPAPPEPELPFVVLSGIATDVVDGEPQRTAVLTTASDVLLVREGEMVGSDYRIRAIEADRVDLESVADGTIRVLRLPFPIP